MSKIILATLSCIQVVAVVGSQAPVWTQATPAISPGVRSNHAMAYDSVRQKVVMFGGYNFQSGSMGDTWEYDGVVWTQVAPASSPPARTGHAMVYDSARHKVVMFGGYDPAPGSLAPLYNDTWEYDGVDWAQVTTASKPLNRLDHAMVYDRGSQEVVMFGGNGMTLHNDTWTYDGVDWTQATPANNPPVRALHAMVYDSDRKKSVIFGGVGVLTTSGSLRNDTWEYDGVNWTNITNDGSPPARSGHAMIYDAVRQQVVMFGGSSAQQMLLDETWECDGVNWIQVAAASNPGALAAHAFVFDSARLQGVMFGGHDTITYPARTWTYGGVLSSSTQYGAGCGSPALGLWPSFPPNIGATASALISDPPTPLASVAMGVSDTFFNGLPTLPYDLASLNMPTCQLLQSSDVFGLAVTQVTPTLLRFDAAIPLDVALQGRHVYLQAFCWAPGANAAQIVTSNGIDWQIGNH